MRLSAVLSRPPSNKFEQVEGFVDDKKFITGEKKKIEIGVIELSFFCNICKSTNLFRSHSNVFCIVVDNSSVSIDCVLSCSQCSSSPALLPAWFLVKCKSSRAIFGADPEVKIFKRSFKLSENVSFSKDGRFGYYAEMLNRANMAHAEDLGAGSVIYLRKILETITYKTAKTAGIKLEYKKDRPKPFRALLEEVDRAKSILPPNLSKNSYELFSKLSEMLHGDLDEKIALARYHELKKLVISVINNIR